MKTYAIRYIPSNSGNKYRTEIRTTDNIEDEIRNLGLEVSHVSNNGMFLYAIEVEKNTEIPTFEYKSVKNGDYCYGYWDKITHLTASDTFYYNTNNNMVVMLA